MSEVFKWILNPKSRSDKSKVSTEILSWDEISKVIRFHQSIQQYEQTPLWKLKSLSGFLGVSDIYIKDEAYRFGLNAFKVLGGSYAIGRCIAQKLGRDINEMTFEMLQNSEIKEQLKNIVFTTATDGNHGRGVAWTARQLGCQAVVYMPKGSSIRRLNHIKETGARAYITDYNYDDTVRLTAGNAAAHGWEIIQDTLWEGYEQIPIYIMQGYATMVLEALMQIEQLRDKKPTHVFVQAGVGSMAGAVVGYLNSMFGNQRPITVVVEPSKADCLFKSAKAGSGAAQKVTGDMDTIMAGLACGEPNPVGWEILRDYCDMFVSVPDHVAARGMRILGNPLKGDERIISGESGAVTIGFLSMIIERKEYRAIREALQLNKESKILLFSTEGDTDPEIYRKIVWDGDYPNI